jgi:hypothetical protein
LRRLDSFSHAIRETLNIKILILCRFFSPAAKSAEAASDCGPGAGTAKDRPNTRADTRPDGAPFEDAASRLLVRIPIGVLLAQGNWRLS